MPLSPAESDVSSPNNAPVSRGAFSIPTSFERPFCYRFEKHINEAVFFESKPDADVQEATVALWPPREDVQWYSEGELQVSSVNETDLQFTANEAASITFSDNLALDAPSVDTVVFKLAVKGTEKLRLVWRFAPVDWDFCSKEGNGWVWFPVNNDGIEHTYTIRVNNMSRWLQYRDISGIRLATEGPAQVTVFGMEIRMRKQLFANASVDVCEYQAGREVRTGMYMHAPSRLTYRLKLPEHPVFTTGLATLDADNPTAFRLYVTYESTRTTIVDDKVVSDGSWQDRKFDLNAFAGKEVEIEFEVSAEQNGQIAFWGDPCIYESCPPAAQRAPNIIIYLIDALRADHLQSYGYTKNTAPTIAQLADSGILFKYYFTHATCTKPSVMTLFSGLDALVHGFRCYQGYGIPEEVVLFPKQMRDAGYSTGAVSENPFAPPFCINRQVFSNLVELDETDADVSEQTYNASCAFLEQHTDKPFFLYIHTMECHGKRIPNPDDYGYLPPAPFDEIWKNPDEASPADCYDGAIVYADHNLKRILEKLEDLGLRENTLLILTADHGEALGDRGEWGHGFSPYRDQIHVPLIFSWPALTESAGKIPEFVQTADLSATILDITGLPVPEYHSGTSLKPLLTGNDSPVFADRMIVSYKGWSVFEYSIIKGNWKLMLDSYGHEYLFSIPSDINEEHDVYEDNHDIVSQFNQLMIEHVDKSLSLFEQLHKTENPGTEEQIDPEKLMMIKNLGYLGE